MAENKRANIPVASHGLHKHSYNFPWLGTTNFCEVLPVYYNTLRAGEKDNVNAGLYSQLMPIAHNAFVTGRYNFKAIYVPFFRVWRPYTCFKEQTEFRFSSQTVGHPDYFARVNSTPYVVMGDLNQAFLYEANKYVIAGDEDNFDFVSDEDQDNFYLLTNTGKRVYKILVSLGMSPNWVTRDRSHVNILAAMCYIKAFADYYFPNQYVNNKIYKDLAVFFNSEEILFDAQKFLRALEYCSLGFYDGSFFENVWDNPVSPNVLNSVPDVSFSDPTLNSNGGSVDTPFGVETESNNKTPAALASVEDDNTVGFTQYVINALKSLSMWMKRKQFSGARLIDRYLVSRGIPISRAENDMSYFMGQRNIEIEVSGVENNTDSNLGELAGRAVASSKNEPLSFKIRAEEDGIFLIICHALPDSSFPVYLDGFTQRVDATQFYNGEFDKLGPVDVSVKSVAYSPVDGTENADALDKVFGFGQNYWDEIQERPRLLGDFIIKSRGSEELSAYHSFRLFRTENIGDLAHGFEFIRQADNIQYQRFFYSEDQDNLMLFLRFYGDQFKEKLPLGDSYEWDDDETNRRVNIVVNGSQK